MRWIKKPKVGTVRELKIVKRFLLFPTRINNEFRWLETAYIVKNVGMIGMKLVGVILRGQISNAMSAGRNIMTVLTVQ